MNKNQVPDIIVNRLPLYLRALKHMRKEGQHVTSSQDLGEYLSISAAQIRKDLSQFGEFGKQGTGYQIDHLIKNLRRILKVNRIWDMAVVGIGDIGKAIAQYMGFINRGYRVALLFDNDPQVIGEKIGDFTVHDSANIVETIQEYGIKVAMIAVPFSQAQEVADQLVKAGVKAILNYAPLEINVPPSVSVEHIDPVVHLQRMTYHL